MDERDDTRRLEFLLLDVGNLTEEVLLSISSGIDFCGVLVRHRFPAFNDLRYLVAKMNYATYYLYASGWDAKQRVHQLSFIKRMCLRKYRIEGEPHVAVWRRGAGGGVGVWEVQE